MALADPLRRELMRRLAAGPLPVHELVRDTNVTRSAISQHLGVLKQAGLVEAERRGREVMYTSRDQGLDPAADWVSRYRDRQLRRARNADGEVATHISNITIPVLDQGRARDFYEHVLGFTVVNDRSEGGYRWVSVLPPGGPCALGLVKAPAAGVWTGISLMTPHLDELYRTWTGRKVLFDAPPARQPWGARTALFADIDGNRFQLVEVPQPGETRR